MVAIKAAEFAFPRMEAPDLDAMEEFLTNFGMMRAERTPDSLYMRGADSHHHLHAVHKGGTKFIGFAYHAASEDDLKRLAKLPGASGIETLNEPGGGKRGVALGAGRSATRSGLRGMSMRILSKCSG